MKTNVPLLSVMFATIALAQPAERPRPVPDTTLLPAPNAALGDASARQADPNSTVRAITGSPPGRSISRFVGRAVQTSKGSKLGTIKDVFVDIHSGRVVYVAVAASADNALRLVPFAALHPDDSNAMKVEVEEAQWEQILPIKADEFENGRITLSGAERQQLAASFRQSEPPPIENKSASAAAAQGGSQLMRLGELRGKRITTGTEDVGIIDDVVVDSEHMTAAAVVGPKKDLSVADRRFLVPLRHLNLGARDQDPIRTNLARSAFELANQRK
jgi:sporulation protein YlmC with PRC-barrel domain